MGLEIIKSFFIPLVLAAVALEALADVLFKKWALTNNGGFLLTGLIIYVTGTIIWAFSLKFEYLSKAITIFSILNLIIVVLVGVFLFKEDLSLINKIGIALGVISVVMIQI